MLVFILCYFIFCLAFALVAAKIKGAGRRYFFPLLVFSPLIIIGLPFAALAKPLFPSPRRDEKRQVACHHFRALYQQHEAIAAQSPVFYAFYHHLSTPQGHVERSVSTAEIQRYTQGLLMVVEQSQPLTLIQCEVS